MRYGLVSEQKIFQFFVKCRVFSTYPFKNHCCMLFFLITIVGKDELEVIVFAGIYSLVIPIHRLQFFH